MEAEALPLPTSAPLAIQKMVRLVLLFITASLLLTIIAAIPGAHACPLTAIENFPSLAIHLFWAFAMISLVTVIGKRLISIVATAPYPDIAILSEANRAAQAVAACCAILATATMYAWQGWHKEVFGDELVMEEYPRHHRWEEYRRDPTNSDFVEWKGQGNLLYARIIAEINSKEQLKVALIALYSRILATDETAKRTGDFIEWMKNNSPVDALVKKLM